MHTTPWLNYTPLTTTHPLLSNLDEYNKFGDIYLTSDDDPTNPPEWLRGDHNRPNEPKQGTGEDEDIGMSTAPGVVIWTEKEGGIVDAFYFYFYSFNQGNTVAGWRFGNHVGDWGKYIYLPIRTYFASKLTNQNTLQLDLSTASPFRCSLASMPVG